MPIPAGQVTANIDSGGRGRPRVTFDVTQGLSAAGVGVFMADGARWPAGTLGSGSFGGADLGCFTHGGALLGAVPRPSHATPTTHHPTRRGCSVH